VETLKETLRELDVEFEVQRKSKNILEDRNDSMLKELIFLRYVYSEPSVYYFIYFEL